MPKNFIQADRDQAFLLPPDMREWLPSDHFAHFVVGAVSELELSEFYASYRDDGWGRAAFEPSLMVALLLYAFARGVHSAREIERRCLEDVGFRIVAENQRPDHSTICRFRQRHHDALNGLFVSVLGLCVRADIVDAGTLAIDGTKIAANASGAKNIEVSDEQLRDYARRVFEEADRIDAAEDELYGDKRGDELPEHLIDEDSRRQWIREQLAAQGVKLRGDKPTRLNTTDPESRPMRSPKGFVQGFNAQLAVTPEQVIVAADVTNHNSDAPCFESLVDQALDNLAASGTDAPTAIVADNGYFSDANATLERGVEILIAPVASRRLRSQPLMPPPGYENRRASFEELSAKIEAEIDRREALISKLLAGKMTMAAVSDELGIVKSRVSVMKNTYMKRGRAALRPRRGTDPRPPELTVRDRMMITFQEEATLARYDIRARTIEPVFGQIKEVDGLRRFLRRGISANRTDFRLVAAAHNLKKIWRKRSAAPTSGAGGRRRPVLAPG